jgi:hypothetical protein
MSYNILSSKETLELVEMKETGGADKAANCGEKWGMRVRR